MDQSHKSPSKEAYAVGSSIRGEKIAARFRKMSKVVVTQGSSTHKIQSSTLEGSVLCVIERPLNYLRDLPREKK